MHIPIQDELKDSKKIFLCGAGGGFDIYSGIPLYYNLKKLGKEVILGNYSFSVLSQSGAEKIGRSGWKISPDNRELGYFPEKYLAEFFHHREEKVEVIGFQKSGVIPLKKTIEKIVDDYEIDTVILVDGGTDSLMRGDEVGLGTPTEDMTTIAAFHDLKVKRKYLTCIGFGVDHFHGVCHTQFLENVSRLIRKGGFKGSCSVLREEEEGSRLIELVKYANQRGKYSMSIVANSITSAIEGKFGDHHVTERTRGSRLFINPLMSMYWFFDLEEIASGIYYLELLEQTNSEREVKAAISSFRDVIQPKKWEDIPL